MLFRVSSIASVAAGFFLLVASASGQIASSPMSNQTLIRLSPNSTNQPNNPSQVFTMGSISGIVLSQDNHPLDNARIEIRNLSSGQSIAWGYTDRSGRFRLDNVPNGDYEVIATSGLSQTEQQIRSMDNPALVTLRLPHILKDQSRSGVVSVQQLSIPQKARDALKKAQEAETKHDINKAQKELAKALEIAPKYSDAIAYRGALEMTQSDFAAAENDFNQAIQLDNSNAVAYVGMGAVYNEQGKYDDAIREVDRSLALNPQLWSAHFELSKAQFAKGNFSTALKEADQAESLSANRFSPLHLLKGHILLGLKLYSGAVNEFQKFLSHSSGNPALNAQVQNTLEQAKLLAASQN